MLDTETALEEVGDTFDKLNTGAKAVMAIASNIS
jgi:hypothetical protein